MTEETQDHEAVSTEEERKAAADSQNLGGNENAVPEQRPQSMTVADPSTDKSDLTRKLEDSDYIPDDGPMPQSAYNKAASKAQAKKAADNSKSEGPMVGNVVISTKGPHEGRVFAVTRIVSEGSVADAIRRLSGDPTQVLNSPKELELTAIGDERDGERLILDVEENGLEKQNEGWRGSRAGRRH